jgi:hypothetical protein
MSQIHCKYISHRVKSNISLELEYKHRLELNRQIMLKNKEDMIKTMQKFKAIILGFFVCSYYNNQIYKH